MVHRINRKQVQEHDRNEFNKIQLFVESEAILQVALDIPLIWLRDHCRSLKSYNHETYQRKGNVSLIHEISSAKECVTG